MNKILKNLSIALFAMLPMVALAVAQEAKPAPPANALPKTAATAEDYSGMYTFLREGEFVQLTVEDTGKLTGFVSRFGEQESDQGQFLDHFFKVAKLEDHQVSFTTQTVHGVRFEFQGTVDRGPAKTHAQEGYYVLKGTLTEYVTDSNKKESSKTREVECKLFPEEAGLARPK